MKPYYLAALVLATVHVAHAQQVVSETKAAPVQTPAPSTIRTTVETNQPVVIVNEAPAAKPETPVEKPAVQAPPAEDKARSTLRAEEANTEKKLSEKLEASRLEDEKNRLNRLTGASQTPQATPQAQPGQPVAPANGQPVNGQPVQAQPQVAQPAAAGAGAAAVVAGQENKDKKDDLVDAVPYRRQRFLIGSLGYSGYPDAVNVKGNYAASIGVGRLLSEHFSLEGYFMYGNYDVQTGYNGYYDTYYTWIKNVDQYTLGAAVKYRFMDGSFTPVVGGVGALVLRKYHDSSGNGNFAGQYQQQNESSQAFDIGALVGVEYKISERFSLGGDLRYMQNVSYKTNNPQVNSSFYYYSTVSEKPLEQINYYILSVNAMWWF